MEDLKQQATNYLKDKNNWISAQLAKVENQTKVHREQIAGGLAVLFSVYLVVGYFAQLVCNFIGFAYPSYASKSSDKNDDTQWLTYWTVFAVFSLVDFAADTICGWFPFYWLAKCVFLIYLYHPLTMGARNTYVNYTRPILQWFSDAVDQASAAIQEGQQAVVAAAANAAAAAPPPTDQHPPVADASASPHLV